MIPDSFIQQLKQYHDIENVVSSYHIHLKRSGSSLVGLCPFHSEKTPSFRVYTQNQSFYCFGCGAGGDVVTFIKQIENLDYMETLRLMAQRAGVQIPDNEVDNHAAELKKRVLEINRETARFYHQCLKEPKGTAAYQYLLDRGRSPNIIRKFGLGYSPDSWDAATSHLKSMGFTMGEIEQAGVAVKNKSGGLYDRFRNRVIFPIIDLRGNVIAFGGRALEDRGPKYLNSADSPVFKKSRNLFALNFAKTSKTSGMILAEGYMDVIALNQAGFDNAIATLGTSLTDEQARLLSQYADKVVIAYDSDSAGQSATKRAVQIFDQVGMKVQILTMTGAKDPDEFIKLYGAERFHMLLDGSSNAVEFEINKIRASHDLETSEGKVGFLKEICKCLAKLRSPIEREVYLTKISQELEVSPTALQAQVDSITKALQSSEKKKQRSDVRILLGDLAAGEKDLQRKQNLEIAVAEEGIIYSLVKNPDFLPKLEQVLDSSYFLTDMNRKIYNILCQRIHAEKPTELMYLSEELGEEGMSRISGIMASAPGQRSDSRELDDYINKLLIKKKSKSDKEIAEMDANELKEYIKSLAAQKK